MDGCTHSPKEPMAGAPRGGGVVRVASLSAGPTGISCSCCHGVPLRSLFPERTRQPSLLRKNARRAQTPLSPPCQHAPPAKPPATEFHSSLTPRLDSIVQAVVVNTSAAAVKLGTKSASKP